jgi:hypothetical protein
MAEAYPDKKSDKRKKQWKRRFVFLKNLGITFNNAF